MSSPELDLDHNATTTVDPRVLEQFLAVERACPGNPSSTHAAGRRSKAALETARAELADALGVPLDAVVFLSCGTEANHIAIRGLGDPKLPVLCSPVEHKSVLAAAEGRGMVTWDVDRFGRAVVRAPARTVGVVTLAHAQGETGAVQPIAAAAALAAALQVPFHVDAAQTLGRIPLTELLGRADTVALSAHKAGGLRGASALLVLRDRPRPLLTGGGQEGGLRAGTVSPSLAAATARAVGLAVAELDMRAAAMAAARDEFAAVLCARLACDVVTPATECLPNTLTVHFGALDARALLPALDLAGVLASQGSACSSGAPEPPAILLAMGFDADFARACVRFSTSTSTTIGAARDAAQRVVQVVERLRALAARRSRS